MISHYHSLAAGHIWAPDTPAAIAKLPITTRPYLTDRGSLTAALMALSDGNFEVNVLNQKIAAPYFHEQRKLGKALQKAALIREVELRIHSEAVVFARSIVPLELLTQGRSGLANLGGKPLGHLLFKDGNIRVSKREFSIRGHAANTVAARRTPYDYQGSRVLVSEFFLPRFSQFLTGR